MTTYYKKLPSGSIGETTKSAKVAEKFGFEYSTEGEIIGYNGKNYLEAEYAQIVSSEEFLAQQLVLAKDKKVQEATDKAYSFEEKDALIAVNATNMKSRASGIYHIEGNLTNNIKLSAYAASMGTSDVLPWNTKENVNVLLDKTACETLTSLMSQLNAKLWTVDFPAYLAQIEAAQTVEEVEAIEVGYESPAEVVDISVQPAGGGEDNNEVTDEDAADNDVPEVQKDSDISQDNSGEVEE